MLISKSSSIDARAKEPSMSALKYLRPEKAETPWFAVGSMLLPCNSFALDHHRIQEHATATQKKRRAAFRRLAQRIPLALMHCVGAVTGSDCFVRLSRSGRASAKSVIRRGRCSEMLRPLKVR